MVPLNTPDKMFYRVLLSISEMYPDMLSTVKPGSKKFKAEDEYA
jgi:hypothetical protein